MRRSLLAGMVSLLSLILLSGLPAALGSPPSGRDEAEALSKKQIAQWIKELGSSRLEIREAATRALMGREEAIAEVRKALNSPEEEVRLRAAKILETLAAKRASRVLAQARALGKEGRVVEMVDRLVYWGKWDKDREGWEALTRFAAKLRERTLRDICPPGIPDTWAKEGLPVGDFCRYQAASRPAHISERKIVMRYTGRILARGEEFIMDRFAHPGVHLSIVAVSGDAEIAGSYSLIVAGGDVKVGPLMESMLICDGDVELAGPPENGLIIARGKVTCRGRPLRGSVVRSENYYQLHNGEKIIIENGTPDPVAFVRFFELSDVGLVASSGNVKGKAIRAGVRLKEVRKDSPFADALRAGDAVMALDGTEVTSAETFRRLLRRKLAQTAPGFTVTVRRGKETLDLSIPMKD